MKTSELFEGKKSSLYQTYMKATKVQDPKTFPREDEECKNFAYFLDNLVAYKKIKMFSHIPNETSIKNMAYLSKMKSMGKRPGVPDFIIVTKKQILFVEMKRQKNENGTTASKVGPDQEVWLAALEESGAKCSICYGAQEAIKFVENNI